MGHNGCILHDYAYTDTEKKLTEGTVIFSWNHLHIYLTQVPLKILKILIRRASAGSEEAYL